MTEFNRFLCDQSKYLNMELTLPPSDINVTLSLGRNSQLSVRDMVSDCDPAPGFRNYIDKNCPNLKAITIDITLDRQASSDNWKKYSIRVFRRLVALKDHKNIKEICVRVNGKPLGETSYDSSGRETLTSKFRRELQTDLYTMATLPFVDYLSP